VTLHVYGFVRSGSHASVELTGVEEAAVRTVEHVGISALVSELSESEVVPTRSNLLGHAHVLETIVVNETVLPMRFGVAVDDEDRLRTAVMEPTQARILSLLDRFEGSVEAIVKGFYVEEALYGSVVRENTAIAKLRDKTRTLPADATYYDRIKLGEMVHEAVRAKRDQDGAAIASELEGIADEMRVEEPAIELQAAHVSVLIDRDRLKELNRIVEDLRARLGDRMKVKVMAPLPPYSFTDLSLTPTGS
jgi:hypothetical protein